MVQNIKKIKIRPTRQVRRALYGAGQSAEPKNNHSMIEIRNDQSKKNITKNCKHQKFQRLILLQSTQIRIRCIGTNHKKHQRQ
jgi:hypothetical protein